MEENNLIDKVKAIVFSVPDEVYQFEKPKNCFQIEWDEATPKEKAFLLVYDLMIESNKKQKSNNKVDIDITSINYLRLGQGPEFLSQADENMFFQAIYSLPSFVSIMGEGSDLILAYKDIISSDELKFMSDLFRRYQMPTSTDFKELLKKI